MGRGSRHSRLHHHRMVAFVEVHICEPLCQNQTFPLFYKKINFDVNSYISLTTNT